MCHYAHIYKKIEGKNIFSFPQNILIAALKNVQS